jgi:hypothetical protein
VASHRREHKRRVSRFFDPVDDASDNRGKICDTAAPDAERNFDTRRYIFEGKRLNGIRCTVGDFILRNRVGLPYLLDQPLSGSGVSPHALRIARLVTTSEMRCGFVSTFHCFRKE